LIANVDQREGQLLHLRLIDPSDPQVASDPLACLNADLLRDGEHTIAIYVLCNMLMAWDVV
jgi:staphylococcal nuclease domain-containing protein 1